MPGAQDVGGCQTCPRAAKAPPRGTNPGEASPNPLRDSRPLKLGQSREDVKLQSTCRRRAVDALAERDERDAHGLDVLQQRHEVLQIATEAV